MFLSHDINDMNRRTRYIDATKMNPYDWQILCFLGTKMQEKIIEFYINIHIVEIRENTKGK